MTKSYWAKNLSGQLLKTYVETGGNERAAEGIARFRRAYGTGGTLSPEEKNKLEMQTMRYFGDLVRADEEKKRRRRKWISTDSGQMLQ